MKRITTILMLLMLVCMGGWAQVVTDYASAGSPVTYSTYVASAGTGAKYAFMMPSDNGATFHKWVGFNSTVGISDNLTVDQLFVLENSSTPSKYWLKRYSNGEYLAGNNSFTSTPIDLTLVNRKPGDLASEYDNDAWHISFDNDAGGHFNNGNGSYNFAGGTGGWSTCIAYGPYYIVDVNFYEYGTSTPVQESVQYIVKDGTTINAPQVAGYISNNESVTIDGEDAVLNCYYNNLNSTTFTMQCARGYVYWDGSTMIGHASNKTKFAIVTYNDETYLYDATNNAFVCHSTLGWTNSNGNPALESNSDLSKAVKNISFGSTGIAAYPNYVAEGVYNTWLNMDGNPKVYFNTWRNFENGNGGNTYKIEIVDTDFDPTDALEVLEDFFNGPTAFANAIAELKAINWGLTANKGKPNYYNFTGATWGGYAGNEMNIIENLESLGYSAERLAFAQDMLANYALNMPATGKFYRIQGATSEKYLAEGLADNKKFNMTAETDASTVFYFNDNKLTNLKSGLCNGVTTSAWAWVVGSSASTVTFKDGLTNGGYAIQTAGAHFYDNGDGANSAADRGGSITNMSSENVRYRSWYLTEVTSLPITFKGEYASFYSPVDLTIPDNANLKVYTGTMNGDKSSLLLTKITGTLPANTGVILHLDGWTEETSINFPILSTVASGGEGDLSGTITAASVTANSTLVLGKVKVEEEDVWGIYKYSGTTLGGFKAYMNLTHVTGGEAKGLRFIFEDSETTGISSLDGEQSAKGSSAVYDLQGRKVANPSRGMYIINGRKVVIK